MADPPCPAPALGALPSSPAPAADGLHAFFVAYRDAFNALDGDRVAALYALPSGIAQGGAFTLWTDPGPLRDNMAALCRLYRDQGYRCADFTLGTAIDQGPRHAVADLRWRIDWHGDRAPWHFGTTYNLLRTAAGWRVLLCTAYEEDALHRAAGG